MRDWLERDTIHYRTVKVRTNSSLVRSKMSENNKEHNTFCCICTLNAISSVQYPLRQVIILNRAMPPDVRLIPRNVSFINTYSRLIYTPLVISIL